MHSQKATLAVSQMPNKKFESCSDSFHSTNIHCKCYICYVWPIFLMELYTYIDMPSHNSVVRAANNTCKYVIMQMYEEELFHKLCQR